MSLTVVADAHIGHRTAARNDALWPMWASATTDVWNLYTVVGDGVLDVPGMHRLVEHSSRKTAEISQVCHCEPVRTLVWQSVFWRARHPVLPPAAPFSLLLVQRKWGKRKAAFRFGSFPGNHLTALRAACFLVPGKGFDCGSIPALPRDAKRACVRRPFYCYRASFVPSVVLCSIGLDPAASQRYTLYMIDIHIFVRLNPHRCAAFVWVSYVFRGAGKKWLTNRVKIHKIVMIFHHHTEIECFCAQFCIFSLYNPYFPCLGM